MFRWSGLGAHTLPFIPTYLLTYNVMIDRTWVVRGFCFEINDRIKIRASGMLLTFMFLPLACLACSTIYLPDCLFI